MPPVTVRPFVRGDEAALVDVWFRGWLSVGLAHPVVTRARLEDRLPEDLAGRWDATVAEAGGRMVGFLALAPRERRLDQLFVAPEAQGRGVGHRLFEVARRAMPGGFWLSTQPGNSRARAFYERAGMRLDRIRPDPSGDRAIYELAGTGWSMT